MLRSSGGGSGEDDVALGLVEGLRLICVARGGLGSLKQTTGFWGEAPPVGGSLSWRLKELGS